jgi:hypothetical protein
MKIKPDPACKCCHGFGYAVDWVDWGATTAAMETLCDCVLNQVPAGREDEEVELDIEEEIKNGDFAIIDSITDEDMSWLQEKDQAGHDSTEDLERGK